jgi:glycosyltransferase involved in cell wall biosynthesis
VDFVGEIADAQKTDFLGNALALLFPIDWPEPFGLVMIEAMAQVLRSSLGGTARFQKSSRMVSRV